MKCFQLQTNTNLISVEKIKFDKQILIRLFLIISNILRQSPANPQLILNYSQRRRANPVGLGFKKNYLQC